MRNVKVKVKMIMRVQSIEKGKANTEINRNFYCGSPIRIVLGNRCLKWSNNNNKFYLKIFLSK